MVLSIVFAIYDSVTLVESNRLNCPVTTMVLSIVYYYSYMVIHIVFPLRVSLNLKEKGGGVQIAYKLLNPSLNGYPGNKEPQCSAIH